MRFKKDTPLPNGKGVICVAAFRGRPHEPLGGVSLSDRSRCSLLSHRSLVSAQRRLCPVSRDDVKKHDHT